MDFLFHKVSDKEKQEIKEQAKFIMDDFSKKLSKIDKEIEEPLIERVEGEREEVGAVEGNEEFRKIIFENAPEKNKDFIIAEKKSW
ncbi:hypothetical protein KAJ87_04150 [Candidatus Pacearchaeota archaeon]|nr:hypothetical protein [Candidatus Pacearchaeota archaeon]